MAKTKALMDLKVSAFSKEDCCLSRKIPEEMLLDIEDSGVYFGLETREGKGYYVGKLAEKDGHILIVGINGSGKSRFLVMSTLETWKDPMVILDCKGELSSSYNHMYRVGIAQRQYLVFDPLGGDVHYNPFELLKNDPIHRIENIREIAYILVPETTGDPNKYWTNMARNLLSAIIIYGFSSELNFIETLLWATKLSVAELCKEIMGSNLAEAKMFISEISGLKPEHQAAIGTDMKQCLMPFVTDPQIRNALCVGDQDKSFSWENIVSSDAAPNVFLRFSQDRLEQWQSMVCLIITQLIRTLERRPDKHSIQGQSTVPILLLLDEFPLMGKLDVITNALTTLRSKKVTFCLVIQSIAQLDVVYGADVRRVLVDNCQYKVMLEVTEPDSQEYFSRMIGTMSTWKRSISGSYGTYRQYDTVGIQVQEYREPVILPQEFAMNRDIWLHTPYGFFCTVKLGVEETRRHAVEFERVIAKYMEVRHGIKRRD